MITVCASSTDEYIGTMGEVLRVIGLTASSCGVDEAWLAASKWVVNYLGYPVHRAVYSETIKAYGGLNLKLGRTPVRGIRRVFSATDTEDATEVCSSEYRLDQEAGFINRNKGWTWTAQQSWNLTSAVVPNSETQPWLVEYEAGFLNMAGSSTTDLTTYAVTSTDGTMPQDIIRATMIKARQLYTNAEGTVQRKKVGDLEIQYATESEDSASTLLDPWRRYF
jgi:hypothetical protein